MISSSTLVVFLQYVLPILLPIGTGAILTSNGTAANAFANAISLFIQAVNSVLSWSNTILNFESIVTKSLDNLTERITQMAISLDNLAAEVAAVQGVQESAVKLLSQLAQELSDVSAKLVAANAAAQPPIDTSALDDMVTKLKTSTDTLAAAVAANTPAAPAPAPAPAPVAAAPAPVAAPVVEAVPAPAPAPVEAAPAVEPAPVVADPVTPAS